MAYQYTTNVTVTTWAGVIWSLKQSLVAAGWVVQSSGTGTSGTYNASGDSLPTAASFAAIRAWFVIRDPSGAGGRSFCFQADSAGANTFFRIKYSQSAGFSGGTPNANTVPSAADEVVLRGTGTDAAPSFQQIYNGGSPALTYSQVLCETAAPYPFAAVTYRNGLVGTEGIVGMDSLVGTAAGDLDPVCTLVSRGAADSLGAALFGTDTSSPARTWFAKGTGAQGFQPVAGLCLYDTVNGIVAPNGLGTNVLTTKDDLIPVVYGRSSALSLPRGYKGISSLLRWTGTLRSSGDTLSVSSSRDFLIMGGCALPWNGTVPSV